MTRNPSLKQTLLAALQCVAAAAALLVTPLIAIRSKYYDLDPDIWWHIRVGDWIASHHTIPRTAIFSQYADRSWVDYSWCFELLVSGFHSILGLPGIPILLVCMEIMISLALLLSIRRVAGDFWRGLPIALLGILAAEVNPLRPMTLTVLFFTLELFLIFEAEQTGDEKTLYWLGPLFVLWANCHIQFVYGIAVVGIYVASLLVSSIRAAATKSSLPPRSQVLKLAAIFGCALFGSCIGPNGWLPYEEAVHFGGQTFIFQVIVELMAMNFRSPLHYIELLLVMAASFAIGRSRSPSLFRPALLVITAVVSFRSLRDMWFAAIAASFVIAEAVSTRRNQASEAAQDKSARRFEPAAYALATAFAAAVSFGYGTAHGMNTADMIGEIGKVYPVAATQFVRDSHLPGPMYNSMNWGGFLIYNLGEYPVSMDPRGNVYGDALLARNVGTASGIKWQDDTVLARSNLVLIERYVPLSPILAQDPDYRLVYQDPIALVFVKRNVQSHPSDGTHAGN